MQFHPNKHTLKLRQLYNLNNFHQSRLYKTEKCRYALYNYVNNKENQACKYSKETAIIAYQALFELNLTCSMAVASGGTTAGNLQ